MKSMEEFRRFREEALLPELQVLEEERKQALSAAGRITAVLALCLAAALALIFGLGAPPPLAAVAAVVALGVGAFRFHAAAVPVKSRFKAAVMPRIVSFLGENLSYAPADGIPESVFRGSRIFLTVPDRYACEDRVTGTVGETAVDFSEVHAEYKTESVDSKGRRQTHWHTLFRGIFFTADFNKSFAGTVVVLPDSTERLLGRIGQTIQSWDARRPPLVRLEDPEFEKFFVVYGDDQIETRYILSTSLMARIVEFRKRTGREISIAFIGSRIVVALPFPGGLFEQSLFRSALDPAPIEAHVEALRLALGVVEDLGLNTRIWSRTA